MVIGNGVDILEISRIEKLILNSPRFLERFYTENERSFFIERGMKSETIAAGFAAKEAISKSFGTGIRGFNMVDIEVLRDALGKPTVTLYGKAKELAESLGIVRFELSLSHSDSHAIAFVIALGG